MSWGHPKAAGSHMPDGYGWAGDTGTAESKGPAPGGLQAPMFAALSAFLSEQFGVALTADNLYDYFTDTWRSLEVQISLKQQKPGLAATPGRSIHGIGLAVDWNTDNPMWSAIRAKLLAVGDHYHLWNLPSEEWHYQLDPSVWPGYPVDAPTQEVPEVLFVLLVDDPAGAAKVGQANLNAAKDQAERMGLTGDKGNGYAKPGELALSGDEKTLTDLATWAGGRKLRTRLLQVFADGRIVSLSQGQHN